MANKGLKVIIIVFLISSVFSLFNTTDCKAAVWISPMNIHASTNVTGNESVLIEKSIYLKNDENRSVKVDFEVTNNSVIFENDEIILDAYEETFIHPSIEVRKGSHTDSIIVKSSKIDTKINESTSTVTTSMVIRVTSYGNLIQDEDEKIEENNNFDINSIYFLIIFFFIITILLFFLKRNHRTK